MAGLGDSMHDLGSDCRPLLWLRDSRMRTPSLTRKP